MRQVSARIGAAGEHRAGPRRSDRFTHLPITAEGGTMSTVKRISRWVDSYTLWAFNPGSPRRR